MKSAIVYTDVYPPRSVQRAEVLRYLGVKEETAELGALIDQCIAEAYGAARGLVCWAEFPVSIKDGLIDLGFASTRSYNLTQNLRGCGKVILFATTIGSGIDRLLLKYSRLSPSRALVLQALGAERIESLCDSFNSDITEKYKNTAPRFSPGYGDLPLSLQTDIFSALDCQRKIGLTLNESLLMSPSKSVTAIIGIRDQEISGGTL